MVEIRWSLLIIFYLFLGGLSAGLFFISALAAYIQESGRSTYPRIARLAALAAPWPVTVGCALLVFDLGRWYKFFKIFLHFKWHSPMSIGSWLLAGFMLVAGLYFWSWLPADTVRRVAVWGPRKFKPFRFVDLPRREMFQRPLAFIGFPLCIGVGIYTGVLLGAVQARPFWNTNLVAQIFLFSALSTGCATVTGLLSLTRDRLTESEAKLLYSVDITLIFLEIFVVVPYVIHGTLSPLPVQQALLLILGGPFTFAFWALFFGAGLVLPLLVELWEMKSIWFDRPKFHFNHLLAAVSATLVIIGGFVLRYVFVYAGQLSQFQ